MVFQACNENGCTDGYIFSEDLEKVVKCKCLEKFQKEAKLRHLLSLSNISTYVSSNPNGVDLVNYDIDKDYVGEDEAGNIPKIKKYIKDFDEKYSSLNLYFEGIHSTQKSTLSRYIGKELIKKGKSVYYILADVLVKMLVDSQRDEELKQEVDRIMKVDVLVLDEFSTDKVLIYKSGYQISFLTSFLKTRIEVLRKSTIFCSNSPINTLEKGFETAIQRLIEREVLDKTMIFKDSYESKSKAFNLDDLWS